MTGTDTATRPTSAQKVSAPKVLIVDDDAQLGADIADYLAKHGIETATAGDGRAMDKAMVAGRFDVIVLDVMMPGEDGLSICRRLDGAEPAVIIMSARGEDVDRIVGLELGADDYLPKPCNPRELLARIRAIMRRRRAATEFPHGVRLYRFAGYEFEPVGNRLITPSGVKVMLTAGERTLLLVFLERPGYAFSREELLDLTQGEDAEVFDRTIDVLISRLRRKLGGGDAQDVIRTIRNVGYKFAPTVKRS